MDLFLLLIKDLDIRLAIIMLVAIWLSHKGMSRVSKEIRDESKKDRQEVLEIIRDMQAESKDFHGRLCTLQERYLQFMSKQ